MNPLTLFLESLYHLKEGPDAINGWGKIQMWGWAMLGVVFFILVVFIIWLIRLLLSLTKAD